jgi:protein-S-isoprenylcysteine O-methyltransferase Ste14
MNRGSPREEAGRLTAAFFFALLAQEALFDRRGPLDIGLFVYNLLLVALFVNQRPSTRRDSDLVWFLSVLATASPLLGYRATTVVSPYGKWVGEAIQLVALGGMVWAAASLGPAVGIGPADRGLVQTGPYRHIRHPLYAFEILFGAGYLTAHPGLRNGLVLLLVTPLQVFRALREERIIEGYEAYRARVRRRFVPWPAARQERREGEEATRECRGGTEISVVGP